MSLLSGGVYGSSTNLAEQAKEKEMEGERPAEEVKEEIEIEVEQPSTESEERGSEAAQVVSGEETDTKGMFS